ncbi:hypothetical protein V1264_005871 [Littorina saxatilis]|uniref:Uncharacterized protein n=2 Tax=Littorina saxatilis TaxID=31220 RepID=A0AAN9B2I0_9CAEN
MLMTSAVLVVLQLAALLDASAIRSAQSVSAGAMTFDPMTSTPGHVFSTRGRADSDRKEPDYIAIASTPDGNHLLLVDDANRKVKVMAVTSSGVARVTSDVRLSKELWDIALLPDGMVAVTCSQEQFIYLLRLQGDVIEYTSRFRTEKKYHGVAAGLDNDTLLVTSRDYLDVITRDGRVVESFFVSQFRRPDYMCLSGGNDVIVSDWATQELYRINASTGQVTETMSHPDMETPHQAVVDKGGNLYVASRGSKRLMVLSPAGEWRTLLQGKRKMPTGVSVTTDDVIVSWADVQITEDMDMKSWSIVRGYSMSDFN